MTVVQRPWSNTTGSDCNVQCTLAVFLLDRLTNGATRRCDSYNTAQIRILREPGSPSRNLEAAVTTTRLPLREPNTQRVGEVEGQGRSLILEDHHQRRFASLSGLGSHTPIARTPQRRETRSTSAIAMNRIRIPLRDNGNSFEEDLDFTGTDDGDDDSDEDDLSFWGGESPRQRAINLERGRSRRLAEQDAEQEEDDSDDGDDDLMEHDMDDDDEEDGMDHMELFGHP